VADSHESVNVADVEPEVTTSINSDNNPLWLHGQEAQSHQPEDAHSD